MSSLSDHHLNEWRIHFFVRTLLARPSTVSDPELAEPLNAGLPARRPFVGPRERRWLWGIALLAIAFRLVLLPIGHPWDLTTAYNVFIDLANNHSPYDTLNYLNHVAISAQWGPMYEYYAYPPVPLYIYFPLAKLFAALHPGATYFFPVEGMMALPRLPWDFYLWYKLPMWIADFLIAALLARMTGSIRSARDYLINPYVLIVSGAWTFDSVMVLGLLAGVYWFQQGKMTRSGLALAFGTMMKFFPALIVPTCILYLIKRKRPIRELLTFLGAYGLGCLALLGPYWQGLLSVLSFHAARIGGGMTWEVVWIYPQVFPRSWHVPANMGWAVAAFGTPALAIVLLLAYWYMFIKEMSFNRMVIMTLLAFFIGSKLVNEQYALMLLPFALIEAYQGSGAWRWFYRLFWIIPLAFIIMHVPIDRFLWLLYRTVFGSRASNEITILHQTGFETPWTPWDMPHVAVAGLVLLGCAFFVLCIVAIFWPIPPAKRTVVEPERKRVSDGMEAPVSEGDLPLLRADEAEQAAAAERREEESLQGTAR